MGKTISIDLLKQIFVCTENGELFFSNVCGKASGKRADKAYCGIYSKVKIFGVFEYTHRIVFAINNGYFPEIVDHIDGNTKNNAVNNLRAVDACQSVWNTKAMKNSTGCKGVHFEKQTGKYRAEIKARGVHIRIGRFITLDEAVRARKAAEERLHGEFARK